MCVDADRKYSHVKNMANMRVFELKVNLIAQPKLKYFSFIFEVLNFIGLNKQGRPSDFLPGFIHAPLCNQNSTGATEERENRRKLTDYQCTPFPLFLDQHGCTIRSEISFSGFDFGCN